jgi:lysophospholipase L1-like esterase
MLRAMIQRPVRQGGTWLMKLLGGCILGAGVLLPGLSTEAATYGSLLTFGDSYTQSYLGKVPSWATQLQARGTIALTANYGRSGATAIGSGGGRGTFDGQLDEWERKGKRLARRTVIYFGYNDINRNVDLGASARRYAAGIDRLIRAGANSGGRRIILTLVHDWSRNPNGEARERARVATWNRHVRSIASARGLRAVDMYAKINAVFQKPRSYDITNTSVPSRTNQAHLYYDGAHFGTRGQRIIADTMRVALAR